jgi:hypothetical protein
VNVPNSIIVFLTDGKIPISPSGDRLFPTISVWNSAWDFSLDANFGEDPAKPFEYDIKNCSGMGLALNDI